jgi:hypothetical protein
MRKRRPTQDDAKSLGLKSILSRIEEENAAPSTVYKHSDD